jgi:hypothetical protein
MNEGRVSVTSEDRKRTLPASGLSAFVTEIVGYDVDSAAREAYGYSPTSAAANLDVIVFREVCAKAYRAIHAHLAQSQSVRCKSRSSRLTR